jgi:hypothetical protein
MLYLVYICILIIFIIAEGGNAQGDSSGKGSSCGSQANDVRL